MRIVRTFGWLLSLACMASASEVSAMAVRGPAYSHGCCDVAPSAPQMVQRTILVPQYTTEKRVIRDVVCEPVQRQRVVQYMECVPETRTIEQEYTALERRQQTRTVRYTVRKPVFETQTREVQVNVPVWETRQQTYQVQVPVRRQVAQNVVVQVPHREERQGTRTECRVVPVNETRTVTCDNGHWENHNVNVPCDGSQCGGGGWFGWRNRGCCEDECCGTMTVCNRVWVPNVQTKEVQVTVYKREVSEVPYTYTEVVYRPENRTKMVTVCDYETRTRTKDVRVCSYRQETKTVPYRTCRWVTEEKARDVVDTFCVPVTKTRTVPVTTYKQVPRERTVTYTDYVSREVEREVDVPVCRMVEKTIMVPADDCGVCGDVGRRGRGLWR
jgi:hypothetical protein